ncbi:MAG TPA: aminoacyl-tRNA hydrolase [Candidatus Binataceae bacterium]|jgi:PTH1 family peptidyl-tRNA hydrolase|nr:aminoacyl-tRNA hydrolase [Candidatus Binataceae bacterium]
MSRFGRLFDKFRSASSGAADAISPDSREIRWLVVGLGNPGEQYRRSRHNIGFMVVERLADARGADLSRRKFNGFYGESRGDGVIMMFALPQTFYNRSGECAAAMSGYFKVPPERVIVIHDDMDLPAGRIRIKRGGGDAGNRGVRSIAESLGKDFIRVRVGTGHPPDTHGDIDYVLKPLTSAEAKEFAPILERAGEAVLAVIRDGLERAMNQFHTRA